MNRHRPLLFGFTATGIFCITYHPFPLRIRPLFRIFLLPFYRWWAFRHIRSEQQYCYGVLKLRIPPGIFHPGIFFSTPIFLHFLKQKNFQEKTVLDVGTGSGILAIFAAKSGGQVTAIDINPLAVRIANQNAKDNDCIITTCLSDLFEHLKPQIFDYILVNPPYYPKNARNDAEKAFFAGPDLDYFDRFFAHLPTFIHPETKIWMILSEDCDQAAITTKAARLGFTGYSVFTQKKWGERFEIFRFTH